jgi:DNA-binding transcriptional MerR regulator
MKEAKNNSSQGLTNGEFSLDALAAESGFTERTIRYYISRGLLEGPARGGRGAFYTREHLTHLREIQRKQQQGLTLSEIERLGSTTGAAVSLPEPQAWWAYPLADDIVVQVRAGSSPWRQHQVKSILERLTRELSSRDESHRKEEKQ